MLVCETLANLYKLTRYNTFYNYALQTEKTSLRFVDFDKSLFGKVEVTLSCLSDRF